MASELAVRATGALEFTDDERKMIRDSFANGASDSEFRVLMAVAQARRLNPLLRQIYFVKRWDSQKRCEVWSTQVSIDGMRAIAERTGLYAGQDEPEHIEGPKGELVACKVRVWRSDWPRPAVGVAYFAEYVQKTKDGAPTRFWQTMPRNQLAKCAESLALRKAFPEDTSGLYTPEEMAQADNDGPAVARRTRLEPVAELPAGETPSVLQEICDDADQFGDALTVEAAMDLLRTYDARLMMEGGPDLATRALYAVKDRLPHGLRSKLHAALAEANRAEAAQKAAAIAAPVESTPVAARPGLADEVFFGLYDRIKRCLGPADKERLKKIHTDLKMLGVLDLPADHAQRRELGDAYKAALERVKGDKPTPPDGPRGGKPAPAQEPAVEARGDAYESDDASPTAAVAASLRAYVASKINPFELERGLAKHRGEWDVSDDDVVAIARDTWRDLGRSEMAAVNAARRALHGTRRAA